MSNYEKDIFLTQIRWHVYNKNFEEINSFEYSAFKFNFHMVRQKDKEDFIDFISSTNPLFPSDLCNFFIDRNIKFRISFRYVKKLDFKSNWMLFKYMMFLKKEMIENCLR